MSIKPGVPQLILEKNPKHLILNTSKSYSRFIATMTLESQANKNSAGIDG
jgi:hypothetical protein